MIERTEKEFALVEKANRRLCKTNRDLRENLSEWEKMFNEQQEIIIELRTQTSSLGNVIPVDTEPTPEQIRDILQVCGMNCISNLAYGTCIEIANIINKHQAQKK
jgi:preprotein translocase subunit SecA